MLRRYIAEQPTSRLAVWARRTAAFSLIATILAIVIVRSGLLEFKPALATFGGALVFSIVALLLAFAAFVVIWREGLMGIGYSLTAIGIGLAPIQAISRWHPIGCPGSTTSRRIRSIRRALKRWHGSAHAMPIRSFMPVFPLQSSSAMPIPKSSRSSRRRPHRPPMMQRLRSSPSANGTSWLAGLRSEGAKVVLKLWLEPPSWGCAKTLSFGSAPTARAHASTSDHRRVTARLISAPMRRAFAL